MRVLLQRTGFTLVEVLMAVAILAVVFTVAMGGLTAGVTACRSAQTSLETSRAAAVALARLGEDLTSAAVWTAETPAAERFVAPVPAGGGPALPRFLSWAPVIEDRVPPVALRYQLGPDPTVKGCYRLFRLEEGQADILAAGLAAVSFAYVDGAGEVHHQWPPATTGEDAYPGPPAAVQIHLVFAEGTAAFQTAVALPGGGGLP